MHFIIEAEQETDGRWIADVISLPGVMTYGASREEAVANAQALAQIVEKEITENES